MVLLPGTPNYNVIVRAVSVAEPWQRYQLPFVGNTYKSMDQLADTQKMYSDYMRNVGREIKYPSIRDFRSNSSSLGNSVFGGVSQGMGFIGGAGKTVRSLI